MLALAFAGVVVSGRATRSPTRWSDFLKELASRPGSGIGFGVVLAAAISSRRAGIWSESAAIAVIAVVAGSFFSIDSAGGSGYLGAFLAGLIVANMGLLGLEMHARHSEEVRLLVAVIADVMVMLVFITLGANLPWRAMADHFWPSLAVIAALIFVARPLTVLACLLRRSSRRAGRGTRSSSSLGRARPVSSLPPWRASSSACTYRTPRSS